MERQLSLETHESIGKFVDGVCADLHLGEEFRSELAAHLEDKIVAYLAGREPLNEKDALLLACEHFGDVERIRDLLADAHRGPLSRLRPPMPALRALLGAASIVQIIAWNGPGALRLLMSGQVTAWGLLHLLMVGLGFLTFALVCRPSAPAQLGRVTAWGNATALTGILILEIIGFGMDVPGQRDHVVGLVFSGNAALLFTPPLIIFTLMSLMNRAGRPSRCVLESA